MAAAGRILARCHQLIRSKARPGVTTAELDEAAERFIRSQDAWPVFKGYRGFPGSICASPNSMVVHGIPGFYRLERGDILSVDIGVELDGWVADAAVTLPIGTVADRPQAARLHQGGALRCRRASPSGKPSRRRVACGPEAGGVRRLLGHPLARGPRDRPRHARGPADRELRRARHRSGVGGGNGPGDRADGQRRRPPRADGRRQLGRLFPGRLAHRALRAHGRDHGDGPRILTPWHLDERAEAGGRAKAASRPSEAGLLLLSVGAQPSPGLCAASVYRSSRTEL